MKAAGGMSRRSALVSGVSGAAALLAVGVPLGFALEDWADGLSAHTWRTGSEWVNCLAFGPDSRSLYCGTDQGLQVWDVASGRVAADSPTSAPVHALAASADGRLLVVAQDELEVWRSGTRTPLETLLGFGTGYAVAVAVDAGGALVAAGCDDAVVRLWPVGGTRTPRLLRGHTGSVSGVAFSADGTLLASGSDDGTVKLWSMPSGVLLRTLGAGGKVAGVSFPARGASLAAGAISSRGDGRARIWDVSTGAVAADLTGGGDGLGLVALNPDGTLLASSGGGDRLDVWDVARARVARSGSLQDSVSGIAFSPDGRVLAVGLTQGTINVYRSF
ncbi:WD40 repeat domain-containing protein [Streptacidiphilus sp. P02-A3a]|uniref:WD40 repeat domain-containing protein n=1 Tax=Streptacidiphilus sp. P02-A3a TaxID=2704468 RepID=UPI0015FC53F3|nr:WD40 repeat domain-containing protein [Streptacidiphilus sp. P02-A3a]QMU71418.1 WD40 repeat domain-containing protein [Streptacidiphilus sp. P02-A3a]